MEPPPTLDVLLRELAETDPDVVLAIADVDRDLIREALDRRPLERVDRVCAIVASLRTFRRVGS